MEVRELVTKLGFDVDETTLNRFETGITKTKQALVGLTVLAAGTITGLVAIAKTAANVGDELYILAPSVGLTVEEYQRYAYALELVGIHQEEFNQNTKIMIRTMGDAVRSGGQVLKSYEALGISAQELKTLSPGQVLERVADGFAKIKDPAIRASIAQDIFGRSGVKMGFALATGSEALKAAGDELERFGIWTQEGVDAANEFNDEIIRTKVAIMAIRNTIGIALFPIIEKVMKQFRDWVAVNKKLIETRVIEFAQGFARMLETTWGVLSKVVKVVGALVDLFGGLNNQFVVGGAVFTFGAALAAIYAGTAITGIKAFLDIIRMINVEQLKMWVTNPYFAIAAGIFLAVLAIQDFVYWVQGKGSLLGDMFGSFDNVKKFFAEIKKFAVDIGHDIWASFMTAYELLVPGWMKALMRAGGNILAPGGSEDIPRGAPAFAGSPAGVRMNGFGIASRNGSPVFKHEINIPITVPPGSGEELGVRIGDQLRPVIQEEIGKSNERAIAQWFRTEQQ